MIESIAAVSMTPSSIALPTLTTEPPSIQEATEFTRLIGSDSQSTKVIDAPTVIESNAVTSTDKVPVYAYDQIGSESIFPDTEPTATIASQILDHFAEIDSRYQTLFSKTDSVNETTINSSSQSSKSEKGEMESLLNNFQSSIELQTEISIWSTQVNLLTSGVSKSTQGVQTLFRNSG